MVLAVKGGRMPFTDYLTLMLVNMVGAFAVLGSFVGWGIVSEGRKCWAPAFAAPGLVAIVTGFVLTFTAPLPKPYNMPFGEMTVFLGVLFLAASWGIAADMKRWPIAIYAVVAGLAAILIGVRIIHLRLTAAPVISGVGFILSGLAGVLAPVYIGLHQSRPMRILAALYLYAVAALWALTGYMAYWMHLAPPAK
jgi:putative membrane protein